MLSSTATEGLAAEFKDMREALDQRFERLLQENRVALKRLAASYAAVGDRNDLFQEIVIAIWRALPGFRGESSERTFLFRIAHNRCIAHISKRRAMVSFDELEREPEDPAAGPERELSSAQEHENLLRAIRSLPTIYREAIVLLLEGLEYSEIAAVLGITESNVGVRLNRARQQLKTLLEDKP